jgi:hypothetical protein
MQACLYAHSQIHTKAHAHANAHTIKQAKRQYRIKIECYYTGSDTRQTWEGLKTITDYKGKPRRELPSDTSLPDELNAFYAREHQLFWMTV